MFTTLLYPTDFSEVSDKALDYIRELSGSAGRHKTGYRPSFF